MWHLEQDARCSGCGHLREESMDAANDSRYVAEAVTCHACKARELANQDMASDGGSTAGTYWMTRLRG